MTERKSVRALLLAALMVVSVAGGSIAFAGTAAANVQALQNPSADDVEIGQNSITQTVSVEVDSDGTSDTITFDPTAGSTITASAVTGASLDSASGDLSSSGTTDNTGTDGTFDVSVTGDSDTGTIDGTVTVTFTYDTSGISSTSTGESVSITVANTDASANVDFALEDTTSPGTASVDSVTPSSATVGDSIDVAYSASDSGTGVSSVTVEVLDANDNVVTSNTDSDTTSPVTVTAPSSEGVYDVRLTVTDGAGNTAQDTSAGALSVGSVTASDASKNSGGSVTVSQGENAVVQTISLDDVNDNGERLALDALSLSFSGSMTASDVDQIQLVVGGSGSSTVVATDSSVSDLTTGVTFDDFTASSGSWSNSDVNDDSAGELLLDDAASAEIRVKVSIASDAASSGDLSVDTTLTALADSAGAYDEFTGHSTTASVAGSNTLTLGESLVTGVTATNPDSSSIDIDVTSSEDLTELTVEVADSSGAVQTLDLSDFGGSSATSPYEATANLALSGDYTVTVTSASSDTRSVSGDVASDDVTPPEVTGVDASLDTDANDLTVSVTGDQALNAGSIVVVVETTGGTNVGTLDSFTLESGTTYTDTLNIDSGVTEDYVVTLQTAQDGEGDHVLDPTSESDTVTIDTAAPSVSDVSIVDETDGDSAVVSGDQLTVSATVTDAGSGVDSVTADASNFGAGDLTLTDENGDDVYTATFTVGESDPATEGTHSLTVAATDAAGNTASGTTSGVDVETIPSVSSVSVSDDNTILATEIGSDVTVTVEFSEDMDQSVSPTVEVVGLTESTTSISGDYVDAQTWEGTLSIPDEAIETTATVDVSGAENVEGRSIQSDPYTSEFVVDSSTPDVESVTVGDAPINVSDVEDQALRNVTIEFSEAVAPSTMGDVELRTPGGDVLQTIDPKPGVGDDGFGVDDGFTDGNTTWVGLVDFSGVDQDAELEVVVTDVEDTSGNGIEDDRGTVDVDTIAPDVSLSAESEFVSGTVDLTSYATVVTDDSDSLNVTYWSPSLGEISEPSSLDTTSMDDGQLTIWVTAVDDAGNWDPDMVGSGNEVIDFEADNTLVLTVDNEDPTVSARSGVGPVSGDISVHELFDITKGGTEQIDFDYSTNGGDTWTDVAGTSVAASEIGVDEESVMFRATVTGDPDGEPSATKSVVVDALDVDIDATSEDGTVHLTVTPEPGVTLSDISVELMRDGTVLQTVTAFEQQTTDLGNNEYVASVSVSEGPGVTAMLASAVDQHGRDVSADAEIAAGTGVIDGEDPTLVDAYILGDGTHDGDTHLKAVFSEPVDAASLDDTDFGFTGLESMDVTPGEFADPAAVMVEFDAELQTGDGYHLNVTGPIAEEYGDDPVVAGTSTNLHTMSKHLQAGLNTFSMPAVAGSVDASSLSPHVDTIWAWDAENATWEKVYVPGHPEHGSYELTGGTGYMVFMDQPDRISVNTLARPSGLAAPTTTQLSQGWNLVGHYKEGNMDVGPVFASVDIRAGSIYGPVATGSSVGFSPTDILRPGDAYWVYVNSDGEVYSPVAMGAELQEPRQLT
jgi:surface glycoprotein (TIGR04207 family)